MSFFGLTSLGPQNDFTAHSAEVTHLHVFDDDDCDAVWRKFAVADGSFCFVKLLPEMMTKMYRGTVPRNDLRKIEEGFEKYTMQETITYFEFMCAMQKLRQEAEEFETSGNASRCDFNSVTELHAAMRGMKMPKDSFYKTKQIAALTATQEYGWEEPASRERPKHFRKGSDLTKFAAELIKNGVY